MENVLGNIPYGKNSKSYTSKGFDMKGFATYFFRPLKDTHWLGGYFWKEARRLDCLIGPS